MHAAPLTRRRFFQVGATGLGGLLARPVLAAEPAKDATTFAEPGRELPLNREADVIVCGAGPAGVTAAITAARAGAKVRLFEAHGALGGVWTSSLLGYLLEFNKPGFNQELVRRLRERDAVVGEGMDSLVYHPEEMKLLLEELCAGAGVKTQLHTRVAAAYREGRKLTTIVTESKSGREAWQAPVFIDATGDGDLGAQAGCEFELGQAKSCPCQPLSMCVLVVVKDPAALADFIHDAGRGARRTMQAKTALLAELRRAGVEPSYGQPTLFQIRGTLLLAMLDHQHGINATDAAAVSSATMRARAELHHVFRSLRKLGGAWEGVQIVATPEQIGIRDGRRIRGRYVVGKDDLVQGMQQPDAVTRARYPVDIHQLEQQAHWAVSDAGVKVKPYDIPLRALMAREVDGLLMAGRCISGDFIAHASYRVTGNAVAMGEAVGITAAVAAQKRVAPHEVPWEEIQPRLAQARAGA